jgi:chitin synthase
MDDRLHPFVCRQWQGLNVAPDCFHRYPVYSFFLPVYAFWCMDDFTWGNTRLVIGEGGSKKVVMNDDEKFDESMIPLKKFSGTFWACFFITVPNDIHSPEYEAEAWDGSHHSDETHNTGYDSKPRSRRQPPPRPESPRSYHQASQSGDYYRDTNVTNHGKSQARLGSQLSHSNLSQQSLPRAPLPMSQHGAPQLPSMPFTANAGSYAGSDYGHAPQLPMPPMGLAPMASLYGMPSGPRNTVMSGMNLYVGSGASQSGSMQGGPTMAMALPGRPMSTFSLATTAGPPAGPSLNPNPSDDELFNALRNYLSTQDLMTVTKKCVVRFLVMSTIAYRMSAELLGRP